MEVHNDPPNALSDSNTVLDLKYLETVLAQAKVIHDASLTIRLFWRRQCSFWGVIMLVSDVMLPLEKFPVVKESEMIKICLECMGKYKLGISTIVDNSGHLLGIFTDGDLRRNY